MATFFPRYIAIMSGFLASTVVGFIAAMLLMPKSVAPRPASELAEPQILKLAATPRLNEFDIISKRNVFDSTSTGEESTQKSNCALVKSELPLKFTGVIYGGSAQNSLVLLEASATKTVDTFLLFDQVPAADALIVDIERRRVILERNNCKEYIELEELPIPKKRQAGVRTARSPKKAGGDAMDGSSFREDGFEREGGVVKATKQWVEKQITLDFTKTLQDAKASPYLENGQIKGFVLTRIRPDSVYEKMGLKDGDVVEAINGIELNDAARAIQTLNAMKNESNIELIVKRNDQSFPMKLQIR